MVVVGPYLRAIFDVFPAAIIWRLAGVMPLGTFNASREQERVPRLLGDWIAEEWSKPSSECVQKCT
jgi:hypothetical protein